MQAARPDTKTLSKGTHPSKSLREVSMKIGSWIWLMIKKVTVLWRATRKTLTGSSVSFKVARSPISHRVLSSLTQNPRDQFANCSSLLEMIVRKLKYWDQPQTFTNGIQTFVICLKFHPDSAMSRCRAWTNSGQISWLRCFPRTHLCPTTKPSKCNSSSTKKSTYSRAHSTTLTELAAIGPLGAVRWLVTRSQFFKLILEKIQT